MGEIHYETPFGQWSLIRSMDEKNNSLQAWNSADLYILNRISEEYNGKPGCSVLIMNDAFGALTLPLSQKYKVYSWNDSFCAEKQIRRNLRENGQAEDSVLYLSPGAPLPKDSDLIVLKNPKSQNFLEFILQVVSLQIDPGTKVIAGDMSRNIHSSTVAIFEKYLTGAKTSLAWKKARLVEGETSGPLGVKTSYPVEYQPENLSSVLINYPNLFAFGRLDPGSAFMIEHMPEPASAPQRIIDVACGDGILALKATELWPEASILCTDESRLAVQSARETFEKNGYGQRVDFLVTDVLEGLEREQADLVLCNPPFHDRQSLSTTTALKMFSQSHVVLKNGGELFVIANRHLGYEKVLNRVFRKVFIHRGSKKFSIIRCKK